MPKKSGIEQELKLEFDELKKKGKPLDGIFYASLILKGVDGLIEAIVAFVILFFNPPRMQHIIDIVGQGAIAQHHHELFLGISNYVTNAYTDQLRYFLVIYLIIHAAIKLVSVVGLLLDKRWAYPFALITLGILVVYQLREIFFVKPSIFMIVLTLFDLFILWLIWREYKQRYPLGRFLMRSREP